MTKPTWTSGKILWTENYDDDTSECFAQAWLRLFGESKTYEMDEIIDYYRDESGRYELYTKGRVCYYHDFGGNIQLDPTYKEE